MIVESTPRCGAQLRGKPGIFCRKAISGNGRCWLHGGKGNTPGPTHHRYKTGRWSKSLPQRLERQFEESRTDPDLLSRRRDIALMDARIGELLETIDAGGALMSWKALQDAAKAFRASSRIQDANERRAAGAAAIEEMLTLIEAGATDQAAWEGISDALLLRNRLGEGERRRLESMRAYLHADQAVAMIDAIAEAVRIHVSDEGQRRAVGAELAKYVSRWAGGSVPGEGNSTGTEEKRL